jgi:hypothetical protein
MGLHRQRRLLLRHARSCRKGRNLTHNPAVSIHLESGDDVVILEGSDSVTLATLDAASRQKYKMPLTIMPSETLLYAVHAQVVLAWTEKNFPNNATRWALGPREED